MNETSYETTQAQPKLLVSVRDADEVLAALAGGADWIDLKEPNAGPLAAVEVEVARKAVEVLAGRRTMSAALGELCDWETSASHELLSVAGISVVKLGLAGCGRLSDWQEQWQAVFSEAAQHEKKNGRCGLCRLAKGRSACSRRDTEVGSTYWLPISVGRYLRQVERLGLRSSFS